MFLRSVRLFLEGLILLLAIYFVVTRALITWVQLAPDQVASVTQKLSGIEINFDRLKLEQTWTGFKLQVANLNIDQPSMQLNMQSLQVDYHLLSPIWPSLPYGERLEIQQGLIQFAQTDEVSGGFDVETWLYQVSKFWRRVNITDLHIGFEPDAEVQIGSLQVSRAERWSALADIDLVYGDKAQASHFQVRARLEEDVFGLLSSGDISVRQTSGLNFDVFSHFWPSIQPTIQRLPSGEFQLDVSASVKKRKLSNLLINLNLEKLNWAQTSTGLPRSASAQLSWDQTALKNDLMQAKLSNLRLDQSAVQDWSEVVLTKQNERIRLQLARASLIPFKPILHSIAGDYVDALQTFELRDIDASFNLKQARFESLNAKVDAFSWQSSALSIGVQGFEVKHDKDQVRFSFAQPIALSTQHTEQQHYLLDFGPGLVLDYQNNHQAWWLKKQALWLNEFPITLQAQGDFKGFVDLNLHATASTLEQVKSAWLPFGLMKPKLKNWLTTALIRGDEVEADVWLKGHLSEFPFNNGSGEFRVFAKVENTRLAFNPNWPALDEFDAKLEFTPFNLNITAANAKIHDALAENIKVNIANLNQADIAVEVTGTVTSQAQNGIDFLLASPLADKLGMRGFLDKQVQASGDWVVELDQIWVPIKGFQNQDARFAGKVGFNNATLSLFNRLDFSQLSGQFLFDDQGVLTSRPIHAQGLGAEDIRLAIETISEEKRVILDIKGQSHLNGEYGVTGILPFDAQVKVPYKTETPTPIEVKLSADPAALASRWPTPFETNQINAQAWKAQIEILDGRVDLMSRLSDQLLMRSQIVFQSNQAPALEFASFNLGTPERLASNQKGLQVNASLDEVDVDRWLSMTPILKTLLGSQEHTDGGMTGLVWSASHIKTSRLRFLNQDYDQLNLTWQTDPVTQQLKADVKAAYLQAQVDYLKASGVDISIEQAQIKWLDAEAEKSAGRTQAKTCKADGDSTVLWPDIRLRARHILLADKLIDSLSFKIEDRQSVRTFSDVRFTFANQVGEGMANYYWHKPLNTSELTLSLQSKRVADLSHFIGFKQGFTGKEASFKTKLTWPEGLTCFQSNNIEGNFELSFNDGVIEQVEPGLARIIGLLSVDSFLRRLKLDLKDVTNEGMEYDKIRANGTLANGNIDLLAFNVSSPGVQVGMNGQIMLKEQTFDLQAQVTPAMGAALPTVATLLGLANPVTGVLAYILAKNISFINEDIVTYNYRITGPWKQPDITSKGSSILFK